VGGDFSLRGFFELGAAAGAGKGFRLGLDFSPGLFFVKLFSAPAIAPENQKSYLPCLS
jgi:hypothetical protein